MVNQWDKGDKILSPFIFWYRQVSAYPNVEYNTTANELENALAYALPNALYKSR